MFENVHWPWRGRDLIVQRQRCGCAVVFEIAATSTLVAQLRTVLVLVDVVIDVIVGGLLVQGDVEVVQPIGEIKVAIDMRELRGSHVGDVPHLNCIGSSRTIHKHRGQPFKAMTSRKVEQGWELARIFWHGFQVAQDQRLAVQQVEAPLGRVEQELLRQGLVQLVLANGVDPDGLAHELHGIRGHLEDIVNDAERRLESNRSASAIATIDFHTNCRQIANGKAAV